MKKNCGRPRSSIHPLCHAPETEKLSSNELSRRDKTRETKLRRVRGRVRETHTITGVRGCEKGETRGDGQAEALLIARSGPTLGWLVLEDRKKFSHSRKRKIVRRGVKVSTIARMPTLNCGCSFYRPS